MIRAACEGCGAAFKAPDKLAGKRVKCPKCGSGVAIPEPEGEGASEGSAEEDSPAAAAGPAVGAAPVAGRRGGSRAGGRKARGGAAKNTRQKARRAAVAPKAPARDDDDGVEELRTRNSRIQRARRKSGLPPAVSAALTLLIVLAIGTGVWFMVKGDPYGEAFGRGIDAFVDAQYEVAIAEFSTIPADHAFYSDAQEQLAQVRAQQAAGERRVDERFADSLYGNITATRKRFVDRDGEGYKDPNYTSSARYLLLRAQEFLDKYPGHAREAEVKGLFSYYRNVANLTDPITEQDVRVELNIRHGSDRWGLTVPSIEALAAQGPEQARVAEEIRAEAISLALADWQGIKQQMEERHLQPGAENWREVATTCKKFLIGVEDLPTAGADAERTLLLAEAKMGG